MSHRLVFSVAFSFAVALLGFSAATVCAQDPASNSRVKPILAQRKGAMSLNFFGQQAAREKNPSLVGLGVAVFLEKGPTPNQIAQYSLLFKRRPDCFHNAMAQIAFDAQVNDVIETLINNDEPLVAGYILAISGRITAESSADGAADESTSGTKTKKGKKKKGKKPTGKAVKVRAADHLPKLLADSDPKVLELALLSAADFKVTDVRDAVEAIEASDANVLAARILYYAKTGVDIPTAELTKATTAKPVSNRAMLKDSPLLSTYDPITGPECYLAEAIRVARLEGSIEYVHTLLAEKDVRFQIEAARTLATIGNAESVPHLTEALASAEWPARIEICNALGAIPDKRSMEPLIAQLAKETGRLRQNVNYALSAIVGEQHGTDAEGWASYWSTAKDRFEPNKERSAAFRNKHQVIDMSTQSLGGFYSLDIVSDRVVFVLDTSASMKGEKIMDVKFQLGDTLRTLNDPAQFNVVTFGGEIDLAGTRFIPASAGETVADQLDSIKLSVATRTYDAIEIGCRLPGVDTIYYLSDGAPVASQFRHWRALVDVYGYYNRYRPVAMYTVEFKAGGSNAMWMKQFATRNGGKATSTDE